MPWPKLQKDDAIRWYADKHGVRVFTDVPVTGPSCSGWPVGTDDRRETIAVGSPGSSAGEVREFDHGTFVEAVSTNEPVRPLIARGHADRTVFGRLATRQAFIARSWRPHGAVLPVALVAPGRADSNVAAAYLANGFEIVAVGLTEPAHEEERDTGGPQKRKNPWEFPEPGEDELLHGLWERRGRAGWWLAEVPVGFKAAHSEPKARRFDAVVVDSEEPRHSAAGADLEQFRGSVAAGAAVELIEAKKKLSASAIGQLLSGAHLFSESWPDHGMLSYTMCVQDESDFAIRWFCARKGIKVEKVGGSSAV